VHSIFSTISPRRSTGFVLTRSLILKGHPISAKTRGVNKTFACFLVVAIPFGQPGTSQQTPVVKLYVCHRQSLSIACLAVVRPPRKPTSKNHFVVVASCGSPSEYTHARTHRSYYYVLHTKVSLLSSLLRLLLLLPKRRVSPSAAMALSTRSFFHCHTNVAAVAKRRADREGSPRTTPWNFSDERRDCRHTRVQMILLWCPKSCVCVQLAFVRLGVLPLPVHAVATCGL
jgi:hypothetical protein